jgi:hypothetical protein
MPPALEITAARPAVANHLQNNLAASARGAAVGLSKLEIVRERLEHTPTAADLLYHKNSGMAQLALGEIDRARDDLLLSSRPPKNRGGSATGRGAQEPHYLREVGASDGLEYAKRPMALAETAGLEVSLRDAEMLAARRDGAGAGRRAAALANRARRDRASGMKRG